MPDFKKRVVALFLMVMLAVFILLGFILGGIIHHHIMVSRMDSYKKELHLLDYQLHAAGEVDSIQDLMKLAAKDFGGEVVLLSTDGRVISDTGKGYPLSSFPVHLLEDEDTPSSMYQTTIGNNEYYTLPVETIFTPAPVSYMQLVFPVSAADPVYHSLWMEIILALACCFGVILFFSIRILKKIIDPVEEATQSAKELARGNYKARTYEYKGEDIGKLNYSLNVLARNLEKMTKSRESQQDRLTTLIENMGSGLILIDGNGFINLVNRAFKEIFNEHTEKWTGHLFYEVFPHRAVKDVVKETYLTERNVSKHVVLPIDIQLKHFSVYSAPILDSSGKLGGIVLVFHDITELKKLEQMRKDFVANVSHELKTPVTSVKGFAETLLDGAGENPEFRKRFLTIILKESERLQSLIQDLLDLSKMEQGFTLNWQTVHLGDLTEETVEMLERKAEEKEITLGMSVKGAPVLEGDAARLKQIIINLISNALTYTPSGGTVKVSVIEKEKDVLFVVQDSGIGMKEEEIPRIFERFYRVDKARSRNSGGTGLGLAIVKHLVEAHHGSIEVKSKPGKGSKFSIILQKKAKR